MSCTPLGQHDSDVPTSRRSSLGTAGHRRGHGLARQAQNEAEPVLCETGIYQLSQDVSFAVTILGTNRKISLRCDVCLVRLNYINKLNLQKQKMPFAQIPTR